MFFMNNFAVADLTMLLFRSLSVDLRINKSNVIDWKYGEYLCYFENTIEVLVSGKYKNRFWTWRIKDGPDVNVINISVVSVWMITMMALDRFGAITSHNYMTKSSSGHYRVRIWVVTLTVWLCAYFLTRQMWVNTEYLDEGRDWRTSPWPTLCQTCHWQVVSLWIPELRWYCNMQNELGFTCWWRH